MILLKLNLNKATMPNAGWRAGLGVEMSQWCRDQGLERDKDYTWAYMSELHEIHFKFFGDNENFSTLFGLRWGEYL
jgi:hypothetical protein